MKKIISSLMASAIAFGSFGAVSASAESYGNGKNIIVLGDSIAAGYGLDANEYNYGEIIADYIGGSVENYAVSGDNSIDLINLLSTINTDQYNAIKNADYVIISIGGNDIIQFASKGLLTIASNTNSLADGYTSADIPDEPGLHTLLEMLDTDKLKEFASTTAHKLTLLDEIDKLSKNIRFTSNNKNYEKYTRLIELQVIPNIQQAVAQIKEINPDAQVIVQTIYNPMQYNQDYYAAAFTGSKKEALDQLLPELKLIMDSFSEQLKAVPGITVADVYNTFTSEETVNGKIARYGWYFTKIQEQDIQSMDIHPTQKGHIAIASNILNTLNIQSDNGSLLRQLYNGLADKEYYPALALSEYQNVQGTYSLGDIDDNGTIDASDASAILSEYAARSTNSSNFNDTQAKAGDINSDNAIDASDASSVLSYYAFLSTGGNGSIKSYINK